MKLPTRTSIAWALYDWANTGYAMIGLALIFPILYQSYWGKGLSDSDQTFWFTLTVGVGSACVFVLAPILGSIAELGGIRKKLLLRFATVGIIACASMYLVEEHQYRLASVVYIIGTVCFYSANIFFDSMLERVSNEKNRHVISGMGFSFGYAAGFLLLLTTFFVTEKYNLFGFEDDISASRFLFIFAACWWAIFTLPLALGFHEAPKDNPHSIATTAKLGLVEAWTTLKEIVRHKHILWFLIAYQFYIDGVNTIITIAANYGKTVGFAQLQIYAAFGFVQIVGIPCAILFGYIGQKIGPRKMIFVAILVYMFVSFYGAYISTAPMTIAGEPFTLFGQPIYELYILAGMIGLCQGGIQALSRSYFTSIIPADKTVAFFGFYSMIGKSAAMLGPLLMAFAALAFKDPAHPTWSTRIGMGMISILFLIGGGFLVLAGRSAKQAEA